MRSSICGSAATAPGDVVADVGHGSLSDSHDDAGDDPAATGPSWTRTIPIVADPR
jgi:hypothetical protein